MRTRRSRSQACEAALEATGDRSPIQLSRLYLTNLARKGYLRRRLAGRSHEYVPTQAREVFRHRVVTDVVDSLMRDYREPLLVHLADELIEDRDMLNELERLIADKRRDRKHAR